MKTTFKGKWKYQSYRPDVGSVTANANFPLFVRWSPPGVLTVADDEKSGTLEFIGKPITLKLMRIEVTEGSPPRLFIRAVMDLPKGGQFTNELHGWFVPGMLGHETGGGNPAFIRGSILQTSADIDPANPQPVCTTGFFVLEPMA